MQPQGTTLDDAWRNLEGATNDDYIAVFAWLDETPDLTRELNRLCEKLTQRTGGRYCLDTGRVIYTPLGNYLRVAPRELMY